jgi:hypothetical protein
LYVRVRLMSKAWKKKADEAGSDTERSLSGRLVGVGVSVSPVSS